MGSSFAPLLHVEVRKNGAAHLHFQVKQSPALIGRSPEAPIRLQSPHVSSRHAHAVFDGRGVCVVDNQSDNGFTVNNKPQREVIVTAADIVRICEFELTFRLAESPEDIAAAMLAILELPSNATTQDVANARRKLIVVWHPDRFDHDAELRDFATSRLQQINDAYAWLKENLAQGTRGARDPTQYYRGSSADSGAAVGDADRHGQWRGQGETKQAPNEADERGRRNPNEWPTQQPSDRRGPRFDPTSTMPRRADRFLVWLVVGAFLVPFGATSLCMYAGRAAPPKVHVLEYVRSKAHESPPHDNHLPQAKGLLSLACRGSWADVFMNGERLGTTPLQRIEVPSGAVTLVLRDSSGAEHTLIVDVQPGDHVRETVELR